MDFVTEIKEEPLDSPIPNDEYNNLPFENELVSVEIKCEKKEDPTDYEYKDDHTEYLLQASNDLCPLVQISESNEDIDTSFSGIHENLIRLGYKNPFVYTKLKRKRLKKKKGGTKWQCIICSETKTDKAQLIEHYNWHKQASEAFCSETQTSNNSKWQCMICSEVQTSKNDLLTHYETHKTETEANKCSEIQGNYYMCSVCSAEFTSAAMYDNHIELKHGESQSICKACNRPFKSLYLLCVHNLNKHSENKVYKCTCCSFEHIEAKELKAHIKEEHEKYACEVCKKRFTSLSWYEEHKNFHNDEIRVTCEICSKTFAYARNLVAHKKKNHPELFANLAVSYSCKFCDNKFPNMKSLAAHLRSHNGPSSLLCDLCGKSLSCYDHLKKHLRIHSGEKPFKCDVCGKGFSDKCNLKLHERVHSGEKPYICNVCHKGFSQRSSLVIHGRLHSGERPYKCELCDKGFVAKGLLGVHRKSCTGMYDL